MRVVLVSLIAFFAAALVVVLPAGAGRVGAPGKWEVVARGGLSGVAPLGVTRTPDGTLHVVWQRAAGALTSDLMHTTISPSGQVGAPTAILTSWPSINGVALAHRAAILDVYFTGLHATTSVFGLHTMGSGDGGRTWSPATTIANTDVVYARVPSVLEGSVFLQAWYGVGEPVVHVGTNPKEQNQHLSPPGTSVNMVAGTAGTAYVAWCSATKGSYGVWVQQVDEYGAPLAGAVRMPGSTVKDNGADYLICPLVDFRIGLAAREGGGIYTAVFTRGSVDKADERVVVWRLGGKVLLNLPRPAQQNVSLAADANGHVWVGWTQGTTLYARRSNRAGTGFGATVSVPGPAGQAQSSMLELSAQSNRLDALVTYDNGGDSVSRITVFHTQLNPGLTLDTTVAGRTVTLNVTDAGDPVPGATVRVGRGRQVATNASGKASLVLPPGLYTATASKPNYVSASVRVRVTKPR